MKQSAYDKTTRGKIYVVVPVYNRKSLIQRFLCCMRAQVFRNFEIIVVDDGSTDGTAVLIAEEFPEVQLLRGDGNLWWTGAINFGIRHAMTQATLTDAVLVINDDVEVEPTYLEVLSRHWQSLSKTLIGSVNVDINYPDIITDGGIIVNWWTAKFRILNSGKKLTDFEDGYYVKVLTLTGRGTLIPIEAFYEIGLYDDKHFQQCGDTELPVRAKNAGYSLIVSYDAVVKSHISASDEVNVSEEYSLSDLKKYFFDVKSNHRLKYRFYFCLKTATNPFSFISFLFFDLLRIVCHFLFRLRFREVV